jgi:hypothetical protein
MYDDVSSFSILGRILLAALSVASTASAAVSVVAEMLVSLGATAAVVAGVFASTLTSGVTIVILLSKGDDIFVRIVATEARSRGIEGKVERTSCRRCRGAISEIRGSRPGEGWSVDEEGKKK